LLALRTAGKPGSFAGAGDIGATIADRRTPEVLIHHCLEGQRFSRLSV
jgi:hypothetical protein